MKSNSMTPTHNTDSTRFGKGASLLSADAFGELYSRDHLAVYRYVYGLTGGSREVAEDLTAETFMRAWKNRAAYHGRADKALVWLIPIARNLVVDRYRYERSRPQLQAEPLLEESVLPAGSSANPEKQLVRSEQEQIMLRLLMALPEEQREILVLRYLLGWKVREIARLLDYPANRVSVYIRRGLEKLKALWPDDKEFQDEKAF